MELGNGVFMIGAACGLVLLITAMRSRTELLLNFILRGVLGMLGIFFVNTFLASVGLSWHVGITAFSAVVSGALGIPGVLLLYGIDICARLLA